MGDFPVTPAIRALRAAKVDFVPHQFSYQEKGGTRHSSQALNVAEHSVIKTLIFEDDKRAPLCVLMHGDKEVSTKTLARFLKVKNIQACAPDVAQKHSGYIVGGTSPFGLRKAMPIFMQSSITELDRIYINGGGRGFLVEIHPGDLLRVLTPTTLDLAA